MNDIETFDYIIMPWGRIDDMTPFTNDENEANAIFNDLRAQEGNGLSPITKMISRPRPYTRDLSVIEGFGDVKDVT